MTRSKLILAALALATLLPSASILASTEAQARNHCAGGCPIAIYHPSYHSAGAAAIRFMHFRRYRIR